MDYKEKLEEAKRLYQMATQDQKYVLESLFPEITESEDERVRKAIIGYIDHGQHYGVSDKDMLTWLERQGTSYTKKDVDDAYLKGVCDAKKELEKQGEQKPIISDKAKEMFIKALERVEELNAKGYKLTDCDKNSWWEDFKIYIPCTIEQKPTDKVEPKFEVGDTVYYNSFGRLVSLTIANIVEDGTDNPMYEDKDGNAVFQNDIVEFVEQKPADMPKFKVGNWITNGRYNKLIVGINSDCPPFYMFEDGTSKRIKDIDKKYHLWTIQDAKDGNIIYFDDDTIVIFKDLYNSSTFHSYCHIEDGKFYISKEDMPDWWQGNDFCPATKEQCELLFSKMKEAGYEWDADKRELKKIEQKPAWSEEDEAMLTRCIGILGKCYMGELPTKVEEELNWLKSLRPQNTWKPSDEQMAALSDINVTGCLTYAGQGQELINLYKDLKKLKG